MNRCTRDWVRFLKALAFLSSFWLLGYLGEENDKHDGSFIDF